jgi:hypothetical protein
LGLSVRLPVSYLLRFCFFRDGGTLFAHG